MNPELFHAIRRPKYIVLFVVLILIGFNALEILANRRLKQNLNEMESRERIRLHLLEMMAIEQSLVGRRLDQSKMVIGSDQSAISLKTLIRNKDLTLLLLFSSTDCGSCVRKEIQELNDISTRRKNNAHQIVGIANIVSTDSSFLFYSFGATPKFPIVRMHDNDTIGIFRTIATPIVVVIDSTAEILTAYLPDPGNDMKRDKFYKFVSYMLR